MYYFSALIRLICGAVRGVFHLCTVLSAILALAILLPADFVFANPTGAEIEHGDVTITETGKQMDINQGSQQAVINWDDFSINVDEGVNFFQPGSSTVALNRVTGMRGSYLYGQLSANGRVSVFNPNGMLNSDGTQNKIGCILASTLDISNDDFLAGAINAGNIVASEPLGAFLVLETPPSENAGTQYAYGAELGTMFANDTIERRLFLLPGPVEVPRVQENIPFLVVEGSTVSLDFAELAGNDSRPLSDFWRQVGGPTVTLNRPYETRVSFIAPAVSGNDTRLLTFERQRQHTGANIISTMTVRIMVLNSGIDCFAADVTPLPVRGRPEKVFGLSTPAAGRLTYLDSIDPATINDSMRRPGEMPLGLVDFELEVNAPGDTSQVVVHLDEPAPAGYGWFKYSEGQGWSDFSEHAEFNGDRTEVTLTLTDGGAGDDDGLTNGIIRDPSGLGLSSESAAAGDGAGGGCFIATAAFGSYLAPSVKILRDFRDSQLLTNRTGQALVAGYYRHSPPLAEVISLHPSLRVVTRTLLLPLVAFSWLTLSCGLPVAISVFIFLTAVGWVGTVQVRRRLL